MKKIIIVSILIFVNLSLYAQGVAINNSGSAADASAILDVSSVTKGMLVPRMTTSRRNSISSPATGLLVYDTDEAAFYFYNGSAWTKVRSGTVYWNGSGSNVTVSDTTYNVGIGTSNPSGKFEVSTTGHDGTYGSDRCSGGMATASSTYGSYSANNAFDNDVSSYWLSENTSPSYLQYDFGSGNQKRIAKYRLYYSDPSSFDHSPASWTFKGSDDGSTWTTLDTRTGETRTSNGWEEYTFSNTTYYRYYRFLFTDNQGASDNYIQVNETEMMEEDLSNHPTLVVDNNRVGIGTSSPSATLDINGTMHYTDGNESAGKVLVSDASGNASWTDGATVNGGGWTLSGNYIYNTSDSVGIGTSSPNAKLEVNGDIVVGTGTGTPVAGTIRWNSTAEDFEGYNGTEWVSLTKVNSGWGENNATETLDATASDGDVGDEFGYSVSIDGDYTIIGAIGKDKNKGAAYIFHLSGTSWNQQAELTDSGADDYEEFGNSVAISGDYAIVGEHFKMIGSNVQQGKAYIFHRTGTAWNLQAELTASDGERIDQFGCSVAIDGDYAVIGAYGKEISGNPQQGKAYIFHRNGTSWTEQAGLTASDGTSSDYFGRSVSISGDYVIAGAFGKNSHQGKAYIFHRTGTTWSQQDGLTASDGAAGDYFGFSVSIDGNYAVVGAYQKDLNLNTQQGKAYVFHFNGTSWDEQAGLSASNGTEYDNFGFSVAINGDYVIVGAEGKDVSGNSDQGIAYIFYRSATTWSQKAIFSPSDGDENDSFGYSVSISDDYSVVGAYGKNVNGNSNQGKTYFYKKY